MFRQPIVWGWAVSLVLCAGCQQPCPHVLVPPYTAHSSTRMSEQTPRRVLLMPVENAIHDSGYRHLWGRLLSGELRRNRCYEIVDANHAVPCVRRAIAQPDNGLYSEEVLLDLREYYRVDAVVFVRMLDFYPYPPPRMSVKANLVDTHTGETLASVDGHWDGRDEETKSWVMQHAKVFATQSNCHPDLVLQSPEYFGKCVARDVAMALKPNHYVEGEFVYPCSATGGANGYGCENACQPIATSVPGVHAQHAYPHGTHHSDTTAPMTGNPPSVTLSPDAIPGAVPAGQLPTPPRMPPGNGMPASPPMSLPPPFRSEPQPPPAHPTPAPMMPEVHSNAEGRVSLVERLWNAVPLRR